MADKTPVLVTGGAGYIGSHAVLALADAGWSVAVIDDLSTGFRDAVPEGVPFYEGDVADRDLVYRVFEEQSVGAIMHFAGSVIVPESVADPLSYYENNCAKSRTLLAAAVAAGVPHFVFSSTAAVYGDADTPIVDEAAALRPITPYGRSKLMTEMMVADASMAYAMNSCILRYFNVAGADPAGRAGQSTRGATHLVKVAVEAATGKREMVAIFGTDYETPDGTGVRDFIHVSDLASAHVLALEALIDNPDQSYLFNCGYGRGFSVLDVLDTVDRVAGTAILRRTEARREGDIGALIADPRKIQRALHWAPRYDDLSTIIEHALAWERAS